MTPSYRGLQGAIEALVLVGHARARLLADRIGDDPRWACDLAAGTLTLAGRVYAAHLVGSYSFASRTFVWGWANPQAREWPAAVLAQISAVRALATQPGFEELDSPRLELDHDGRELAYVAGELAGGHVVFGARHGQGVVYFLLPELAVDVQALPSTYLPGVLLELGSFSAAPGEPCAKALLHALGFRVSSDIGESWVAQRPGCKLRFAIEGARIATVELSESPFLLRAVPHAPGSARLAPAAVRYLEVVSGSRGFLGWSIELAHAEPERVGRDGCNAYALGSGPRMSRPNTELFFRDGSWCVRDNGSTNGTYVEGRALAAGEEHVLREGDLIGVGGPASKGKVEDSTTLRFTATPPPTPTSARWD